VEIEVKTMTCGEDEFGEECEGALEMNEEEEEIEIKPNETKNFWTSINLYTVYALEVTISSSTTSPLQNVSIYGREGDVAEIQNGVYDIMNSTQQQQQQQGGGGEEIMNLSLTFYSPVMLYITAAEQYKYFITIVNEDLQN
jgi:hypothetical protein